MKQLPPELITQLIELLHVAGGILIGWVAKWLQRQQPKQSKLTNNEKANNRN